MKTIILVLFAVLISANCYGQVPTGRNGKPMRDVGDLNAPPVKLGPNGYPRDGLRFQTTNPEPAHVIPKVFGTPKLGQLRNAPLSTPDIKNWLVDPFTEKVVRAPFATSSWEPNAKDDVAILTSDNPGVRADLYVASQRHLWPFLDEDYPAGTVMPPEIRSVLERDIKIPIIWTKEAALPSNKIKGNMRTFIPVNELENETKRVPIFAPEPINNVQPIEKRLEKLESQMDQILSLLKNH